MPVFDTKSLCEKLRKEVESQLLKVKVLSRLEAELLLEQPLENKWSIAQIVEHLNTYNVYYNSKIQNALAQNDYSFNPTFSAGVLGNYFTTMMEPKGSRVPNKMKAFKSHSP